MSSGLYIKFLGPKKPRETSELEPELVSCLSILPASLQIRAPFRQRKGVGRAAPPPPQAKDTKDASEDR